MRNISDSDVEWPDWQDVHNFVSCKGTVITKEHSSWLKSENARQFCRDQDVILFV